MLVSQLAKLRGMRKKLMTIGALVLAMFALPISSIGSVANAHFLITDQTTGFKGQLHVAPDDDPIAGEESIISFDFSKTDIQISNYTFTMSVKDNKKKSTQVPLTIVGRVVIGRYTFPYQGAYNIYLNATNTTNETEQSILTYSQRVSRGTEAPQESLSWQLVTVAIGLPVVVITLAFVLNRIDNRPKHKSKKESYEASKT